MTTNTDTQAHGGGVEAVRQRVRAAVEVALAVCHREGYGVALSANAEDTFVDALMPIAALAASPAAPAPAAGVELDLEGIAKSLASMLIEYVEGGINSNQNWRNGLNEIIHARLRRLASPAPDAKGER